MMLIERSPIMPVSSATGMNSSGGIRPRMGETQRASISNPESSPVCKIDLLLEIGHELIIRDRCTNIGFQRVAGTQFDLHPAFEPAKAVTAVLLGRIGAMSARRISISMESQSISGLLIPIDAVMQWSVSPIVIGRDSISIRSSATRSTVSGNSGSNTIQMPNSSPPSRQGCSMAERCRACDRQLRAKAGRRCHAHTGH
jgi:hypothetical protein